MTTPFARLAVAAFGLLLATFACDALAQSVGRVEFVTGGVRIERANQTLIAIRGTLVNEGDAIVADPTGQVQLRMVDDAFLALRPGTRLRLDQYRFNRAGAEDGVVLNLVQGVLRAFTGQLALRSRERFRMKTTIATVGIRGSGNILAHFPDEGTVNHTLTGSHSVTAQDAQGVEQTLVSLPGQTIQVLPGGMPRFVPTPPYIFAAASSAPAKATASAQASSTASSSSSGSSSSSSQDSGGTASSSSSASGGSDSSATSSTSTSTAAASSSAAGSDTAGTASSSSSTASSSSTSAASSSSGAAVTSPSLATPTTALQASNQTNYRTVGMTPGTDTGVSLLVLGSLPYAGGGRVGLAAFDVETGSATPVKDANGVLRSISPVTFDNFLDGPMRFPNGYPADPLVSASLAINGGTAVESFRNIEQNIELGRIEGATVRATGINCSCGATETRDLTTGSASLDYVIYQPTSLGIIHSLTGVTDFRLDGATRPTDGAGRVGTVNSATMTANFTNSTLDFAFNLSVNNLVYSGTGSGLYFDRVAFYANNQSGDTSVSVTCSGAGCAPSYRLAINGAFAGNQATNAWIAYRINPDRADDAAFTDVVTGAMAFVARTLPLQGIVLPATGTMNLTMIDNYPGTGYYTGNTYPAFTTSATANADFTNRRGGFVFTLTRVLTPADVAAGFQPQTVTVSTANRPIVGTYFFAQSASLAQPNSLVVTCTGCNNTTPIGRFEAFFSYVDPARTGANLNIYWNVTNNQAGTLGYDYYGSTYFGGSLVPAGAAGSSATLASTLPTGPRLALLPERALGIGRLPGRAR